MAGNFRFRSIRTYRMFFWSYSNSTHDPRYGITFAMKVVLSPSDWKNTPGLRCSWLTMTRSVPLMMKVPFSVSIGISPK